MHKPLQHFHDELNQLFAKACDDQQNGLLDAAGTAYLQLLDYFFEAPILHYNLGLVYYGQGEYEKARDAFATAAELHPGDIDTLFNLALAKKQTGDPAGAIACYRRLLQTAPEHLDALYNLAGCYKDSGRPVEAMTTYREVLRLAPHHPSANNNLAYLYHLSGEIELAVRCYRQVLRDNPEHQAARHMIAALTGAIDSGSLDLYVKGVFDHYSEHYEQSLVTELEYCVPTALRTVLDQNFMRPSRYVHGLDLGCGTGLGGQAFADRVEVFDGIDLSEKMITLAAEKGFYRSLHSGSIVDFIMASADTFDFYLAADVFAYIGDLKETFQLLRHHARPDVLFCFSTETAEGNAYRLQRTGRFAHSPNYIQQLARVTGWQVAARDHTLLRKEKGAWVKGDLWFLQLL